MKQTFPEAMLPQYATHLPLLAACVAHTSGPVMELGCGAFSTPVLHALCAALDRPLVSLENDEDWYRLFAPFGVGQHKVAFVKDWDAALADCLFPWDVVLVDHSPPTRRVADMALLRPHVRLMVVHDSHHRLYDYEPLLTQYAHRLEWKRYQPWTDVVSDVDDLSWLKPIAEF